MLLELHRDNKTDGRFLLLALEVFWWGRMTTSSSQCLIKKRENRVWGGSVARQPVRSSGWLEDDGWDEEVELETGLVADGRLSSAVSTPPSGWKYNTTKGKRLRGTTLFNSVSIHSRHLSLNSSYYSEIFAWLCCSIGLILNHLVYNQWDKLRKVSRCFLVVLQVTSRRWTVQLDGPVQHMQYVSTCQCSASQSHQVSKNFLPPQLYICSIRPPQVLCYLVIHSKSTHRYYVLTLQQRQSEMQLITSWPLGLQQPGSTSSSVWMNSPPFHLKLVSPLMVNNQPVIDFSVELVGSMNDLLLQCLTRSHVSQKSIISFLSSFLLKATLCSSVVFR